VWRVWIRNESWFRGRGAVARIGIGGSVLVGHFFIGLEVAPEFCYAAVGIVVFHVHCQAVQLSWWRHGCPRKSVGCYRVLLESALMGGQFAACKAVTGGTISEQKNMHNQQ
jgi:hypothetical protein